MRSTRQLVLAAGTVAVLGVVVVLATWLKGAHPAAEPLARGLELHVDTGADRGPGTLREALYTADAADRPTTIVIGAVQIALETPLPALVNVHGIHIVGREHATEIDARRLTSGPVLDVDAGHSSVAGVRLHNCVATGVLVRSDGFQFSASEIESCDIGLDVAGNANSVSVEHSRFANNRIGVRFAGPSHDTVVAGSRFSGHKDSGLWAVRATPGSERGVAINVHDNGFDHDHIGIVAGNMPLSIERNTILNARDAAVHLIGAGVAVRGNRISGGAAMGIIADGTHGVVIEDNEVGDLAAYAILVRNSGKALVQRNRIHGCGYGLGFVLGVPSETSSALENTIIGEKYDGIDVVGDSPTLRQNRVIDAHGQPLKVEDFRTADGTNVVSRPYLADNALGTVAGVVVRNAAVDESPVGRLPK